MKKNNVNCSRPKAQLTLSTNRQESPFRNLLYIGKPFLSSHERNDELHKKALEFWTFLHIDLLADKNYNIINGRQKVR